MITSNLSPSPSRNPAGAVLVVEDNDTTRARIASVLRQGGYAVTESVDGLDALKQVSARPFDAIVLDLVMPHVDGWQFRATQMRHPALAAIPTVVVTVHPLRQPDRYALRAADVLQKPFDDVAVLNAVNRACRTRPALETGPTPTAAADALFWSRRGEIACATHAPEATSGRWQDERWTAIPADAGRNRINYQCQYCAENRTPIARRSRVGRTKR